MQSTIAPLHRLTFTDLSPDGVQGIAMNPRASTVYVHAHRQLVDPLAAALMYWPWVLTVMGGVVLVFMLWRAARIRARPERRGVPYCRRCRYDLSGVPIAAAGGGGGPPACCPECGASLSARSVRRGRSRPRRLLVLAVPGVVLAGIGALGVALAAGWRPDPPDWPSVWAQWVVDRLGVTLPVGLARESSVIIEVDLATGSRVRTVLAHTPPLGDFAVDPTGRTIIGRGDPHGPFIQYSARWGFERRRLDVPHVPREWARGDAIAGFASDGSAVYVRVSDSEVGPTARIVRWSLVDGSTSIAAEIPIVTIQHQHGQNHDARRAMVVPGTPDRILAMADMGEYFMGRGAAPGVTLHDGPGPAKVTLPRSVSDLVYDAAVARDGGRIYLSTRDGIVISDPNTLAALEEINPPAGVVGNRTGLFGFHVSLDVLGQFVAVGGAGGDTIELYDTLAHAWHTPLVIPTGLLPHDEAEFSSDGVYAASSAFLSGGGFGPGMRTDLLIWNVGPVRAALPRDAR